jgi:hypothetical protein
MYCNDWPCIMLAVHENSPTNGCRTRSLCSFGPHHLMPAPAQQERESQRLAYIIDPPGSVKMPASPYRFNPLHCLLEARTWCFDDACAAADSPEPLSPYVHPCGPPAPRPGLLCNEPSPLPAGQCVALEHPLSATPHASSRSLEIPHVILCGMWCRHVRLRSSTVHRKEGMLGGLQLQRLTGPTTCLDSAVIALTCVRCIACAHTSNDNRRRHVMGEGPLHDRSRYVHAAQER